MAGSCVSAEVGVKEVHHKSEAEDFQMTVVEEHRKTAEEDPGGNCTMQKGPIDVLVVEQALGGIGEVPKMSLDMQLKLYNL